MTARVILDNRRTPCAVGLIRAARTMESLPPDTVLEIWSRDRFAPMEIRIWAERDGLAVTERGEGGHWPRRHRVFEVYRSQTMPYAAGLADREHASQRTTPS
ncbi:sulfurtransferase TusA family protein [Intrasporangium calvum]|uniref:Sulfurtransferase TusA family protein n=1 Tax=Intrasporangium calvum TaxID=53358 RepID=A0ABT5GIV2_9MICO|nr:sulfurtransferase TusA family protein [Intrasporangium calvum]MDC5698019.1 sulfurtransferase TusA family protein [Intrasporangium calvum]